jgi:DNA-binding MarR family transcriptional regulator
MAKTSPNANKHGKKKSFIEKLYSSQTKFRLFSLFEIYRSLTLQEAADLLKRDKSSIHPHLKFLIKNGLVQEPTRIDENRNNIYELAPDYDLKLRNMDSKHDYSEGLTIELLRDMLASSESMIKAQRYLLKEESRFHDYLNGLGEGEEGFKKLWSELQPITRFKLDKANQIFLDPEGNPIHESLSSNSLVYFDEKTFLEFKQEFFALLHKYENKQDEVTKNDPQRKRSVCFMGHSVALEPILSINTKKSM